MLKIGLYLLLACSYSTKKSVDKEISLDDGLYMLSHYKLGPTSYTSLRQDLKLKDQLPECSLQTHATQKPCDSLYTYFIEVLTDLFYSFASI